MAHLTKHDELMPMSEINVTPLVDVMLVLLIIFMVTSPMMIAGIDVELPETSAAPMQKQEEPITVSVDNKGRVYIQEHEVGLQTLAVKMDAISKENKEVDVVVRGDKAISYGQMMAVVGTLSEAGYRKIGLVTAVE